MTRKTSKSGSKNQESDALQSLLSDKAEARLQREINISRSDAEDKSKKSQDKQSSGASSGTPSRSARPDKSQVHASGMRKMPSMSETKAQLIERMKKIFLEMDRLEAGLEQKDLEREKAEKDKNRLVSDLERLKNEKSDMDKELSRKNESHAAFLDKQRLLEKKVQDLEKENKDFSLEIQKKESIVSNLEEEKLELQSRVQEMDARFKELSNLGVDFNVKLSEKDNEIFSLNQEIQRLQEDNEKFKKEASARQKEKEVRQKQMGATDWRDKADSLWDGSGFTAPQKAINYLNAGLELKPDWPEAFNDRGLAYLDDYQFDNALNDFTTAIALKDDFAEAYHNRGMVLLKAGKKFAAKKDFQMAARHGLWLGMNALSTPPGRPGLFERIRDLLGMRRKD